ncbi:hypothetical protein [Geminocystis sp. NIES-3709]|uniref:hypothetical protein n=1 Tax=Geminocystis sp. NIES-3709 TaxID=1617448 RepID=UPI00082663DF|nr:hypothetical protein [Geminocystis sp. NIES-3709]
MIKSQYHNLFTSIFPHQSECPSLIIKFLLVLEIEQLIPLFKIHENYEKNSAISAFVTTKDHQNISVASIISESMEEDEDLLFFGSNFEVLLGQKLGNKKVETETIKTFLIFTRQGLILENDDISYDLNRNKYQFIEWDCWQDIFISFDQNEPKCSLIFIDRQGYFLEINTIINNSSEVEKIEKQLPIIFCYFILKRFWKYVEKLNHNNFVYFNPQDFLYLDQERLSYFSENILSNINVTEEDLYNLVGKIDHY